jgi:hypothetical protein
MPRPEKRKTHPKGVYPVWLKRSSGRGGSKTSKRVIHMPTFKSLTDNT